MVVVVLLLLMTVVVIIVVGRLFLVMVIFHCGSLIVVVLLRLGWLFDCGHLMGNRSLGVMLFGSYQLLMNGLCWRC